MLAYTAYCIVTTVLERLVFGRIDILRLHVCMVIALQCSCVQYAVQCSTVRVQSTVHSAAQCSAHICYNRQVRILVEIVEIFDVDEDTCLINVRTN